MYFWIKYCKTFVIIVRHFFVCYCGCVRITIPPDNKLQPVSPALTNRIIEAESTCAYRKMCVPLKIIFKEAKLLIIKIKITNNNKGKYLLLFPFLVFSFL